MSSIASTSHSSDWRHLAKGCGVGAASAVISKSVFAPIDRLKLVLQLQNAQAYLAQQRYSGPIDCLRKIKSEQGFRSLWRGNTASIARIFPSYALNFAFRDYFRLVFLGGVDRKKEYARFVLGNFAAGAAGAAVTLCICYPLDFARTRLAVDSKKDGSQRFKGMNDCLKKIYSKEGIQGLYRGFFVSLQFVVVSRAVFFGLFDTIRLSAVDDDSKKLSFLSHWCLAQTCIVTSGIMCYPLDTVKRRLMMESGKKEKIYSGSIDCFQKIWRKEGTKGFFKGAVTNSFRTTSGALVLAIYYEVQKYI